MKHLLILFSLALAVMATSCFGPEWEQSGEDFFVREFTYNGHNYIEFKDNAMYGQGYVHDPDCPCHSRTLTEWQQLQLAIAITESKCNPNATGASQDVGVLQLRPIYVAEANRVGGTNYAHSDAYDPLKSLLMFRAVQDYHNPEHDQNKAIKLHNKAPWYARKVKDNLEFVQRYEAVRSLL